jgi:hypothetical protein
MLTDPVTSGEFQEQSAVEATGCAVVDILYGGQVAQLCGSDTKLAQAVRRYLFTVFGYGCNLGPNQTTSPRRRRCAGSTPSTSTSTSWMQRWWT